MNYGHYCMAAMYAVTTSLASQSFQFVNFINYLFASLLQIYFGRVLLLVSSFTKHNFYQQKTCDTFTLGTKGQRAYPNLKHGGAHCEFVYMLLSCMSKFALA